MNNVIRQFAQKDVEIVLSEQDTHIATALTNVLASIAQLGYMAKELSKHFDAIEKAIDVIDDSKS
jgi:Holliday junction resolvasome RuvABC DNA-binding subunit